MTVPKNILEWRKQHNEKLVAQGLPPREPNNLTLEELSISINNTLRECDAIIARMKNRDSTPSGAQE
jgi:hypothetical protein